MFKKIYSHTYILFLSTLILVSLLEGCAFRDMYSQLHVTQGNNPENEDVGVLFRNIYYYRVFEYCPGKKNPEILKDNLFRFRMTGKAYSLLFTKTRFEAGILHKGEIDPFGTPITFNSDSNKFEFTSKQDVELKKSKARLEILDKEFITLLGLVKKYNDKIDEINKLDNKKNAVGEVPGTKNNNGTTPGQGGSEQSNNKNKRKKEESTKKNSKIETVKSHLEDYIRARAKDLKMAAEGQMTQAFTKSGPSALCKSGNPAVQESWILGPEGWRKFDPDERLVLAMSISGKPILGPIKELAGRVLNEQTTENNQIQLIEEEKDRIKNAKKFLDQKDDPAIKKSSIKITESLISILQGDANTEPSKSEGPS